MNIVTDLLRPKREIFKKGVRVTTPTAGPGVVAKRRTTIVTVNLDAGKKQEFFYGSLRLERTNKKNRNKN